MSEPISRNEFGDGLFLREIPKGPIRIITSYWAKPGPGRAWDWSAMDANYDGGDPIGYGRDEQAAIADFLERLDSQ